MRELQRGSRTKIAGMPLDGAAEKAAADIRRRRYPAVVRRHESVDAFPGTRIEHCLSGLAAAALSDGLTKRRGRNMIGSDLRADLASGCIGGMNDPTGVERLARGERISEVFK